VTVQTACPEPARLKALLDGTLPAADGETLTGALQAEEKPEGLASQGQQQPPQPPFDLVGGGAVPGGLVDVGQQVLQQGGKGVGLVGFGLVGDHRQGPPWRANMVRAYPCFPQRGPLRRQGKTATAFTPYPYQGAGGRLRPYKIERRQCHDERKAMPAQPESTHRTLECYRAYLDCLTYIQVDPRLWRRFGWSDIVNQTLLEAHCDLDKLQKLDEADRNRRLRRMLVNNLLDRIEHERAEMRDYRREASLDAALSGSSCNLQQWLADDVAGPEGRVDAAERGARLADALSRLPQREREALILQKYHGWSLTQIAEHLGCTSGAVAGLHARGLKRLRQLLTEAEEST
jgi:RNA polymerase sigma-70 factor (ECF subfamily)